MDISPEEIISFLFEGWETTLHNVDSLLMVVRDSCPDWEERVAHYQNDPERVQYTKERFSVMRNAVEAILRGEAAVPLLEQAVRLIEKPPN